MNLSGHFDVPYARAQIEEDLRTGKLDPERVRKFVWYGRWKSLLRTLPKGSEDVLVAFFKTLDEARGFGTETNAWAALKALHVLLRDEG